MSDVEEDEEFLYGSDGEQKTETKTDKKTQGKSVPESVAELADDDDEEEEDESEYESDSEDDIQIIVDSKKEEDKSASGTAGDGTKPAAGGESSASESGAGSQRKTLPGHQESSIDVENAPMYKGKPLTELDLQKLEQKPWRLPGADITDYFNYGFNELTWLKYLGKHEQVKAFLAQQPAQQTVVPPPFMPMPPQFNMFNPMAALNNANNQGNRMWNNNMMNMQDNNKNQNRLPPNAKLPQIPKMTPPPGTGANQAPLPPPTDSADDRDSRERNLQSNQPTNYRSRRH